MICWGDVIEQLKRKGFTQKSLAVRVGVDQSTICRIGAGECEPRFSVGSQLLALSDIHVFSFQHITCLGNHSKQGNLS